MKLTRKCNSRRAATAVEFAMVAPVLFMLLYGLMVGGLEVFRYQQMASLARDCARWASVHGSRWANSSNNGTLTTQQDVFTNVVEKRSFFVSNATLEANSTVTWDDALQTPTTSSSKTNRVHVTLKYPLGADYLPFVGAIFQNVTVQSTCERPMEN
jgi:Flp pilus assembly protein TadG